MPVVLHLRYNRVNGFYSPILDLQSTTTTSSLVEVGSEKGFLVKAIFPVFLTTIFWSEKFGESLKASKTL